MGEGEREGESKRERGSWGECEINRVLIVLGSLSQRRLGNRSVRKSNQVHMPLLLCGEITRQITDAPAGTHTHTDIRRHTHTCNMIRVRRHKDIHTHTRTHAQTHTHTHTAHCVTPYDAKGKCNIGGQCFCL